MFPPIHVSIHPCFHPSIFPPIHVSTQATDHSYQVDANISTITQLAKGVQADIKNLSSCINQQNLYATNAATAANQAHDKADSVSKVRISFLYD